MTARRESLTLLALDPSIAHVGWAVLRKTDTGLTGGTQLVAMGTEHVPPSDEDGSLALETRMARLWDLVFRLAGAHSPTHAVIERPVTSTVYARHRRHDKSQTMLAASRERQELATGGLWMACHAVGIRAHFAAPVQIRYRTADALSHMVTGLPNRTSEHARAALALGLAALADGRRRWAA